MIDATQLNVSDSQYAALQGHVSGNELLPIHKLVLTRFSPVWRQMTSPLKASYHRLDTEIYNGAIKLAAWNGDTSVVISDLANEDSALQTWLNTTPTTLPSAPRALSFATGAGWFWQIPVSGANFTSPFDTVPGFTRAISGFEKHMFLSAVGPGGFQCHLIGLTSKGNWRLAHYNAESVGGGTWVSNIYWPYQVRSFDAVRLGDVDIIAMETDLPPFDDYTTNGAKTTVVAQRVQGIIVFKYDHVNHAWSSHYLLDTVDNQAERAIGHIKLTEYNGMLYATYFRDHNGVKNLCITRSADGINWENPTYLPEMANSTMPISEHSPVSLVRNGKYMYLLGAGGPGSSQVCYRALATDYMGVAAPENTLDVTEYVTNVTLTVEARRSATATLGDPTVNLPETGYGITGLVQGELGSHALFKDLRAMRARLSLGYNQSLSSIHNFQLANYPIMPGSVELTLSIGYIVNDDTYGNLRADQYHGHEAADWQQSVSANLITATHTMASQEAVQETVLLIVTGDEYQDNGNGLIQATIPGGAFAMVVPPIDDDSGTNNYYQYPVYPVTPGTCTLYTGEWTITDDEEGNFVGNPVITGTINYETGVIVINWPDEYRPPFSSDVVLDDFDVDAVVDYDAGIITLSDLTPIKMLAVTAANIEIDYYHASILGQLNYTTGAGVLTIDEVSEFEASYYAGSMRSEVIHAGREPLLTEQLYGVVTKVRSVPGLESGISLDIQDQAILTTVVGNSDSNEWLGSELAGDTFAPLYADDLTGTSGLQHTVIKNGVWAGSGEGLIHTCADEEGLAITNLIKASQNCTFTADVDFYCGIQSPIKLTGDTSAIAMDGHEYAGLGIRMKDQHSGWWVRVTPRNDQQTDFQLMLRHSATRTIPATDTEPETTETVHVDTEVPGAGGTSPSLTGYDDYYTGRIAIKAFYNRISVRAYTSASAVTLVFAYEPVGMGDREFHIPIQDMVYPKPLLENGEYAWPYTSGYCAYIAKGTGIYVDHGSDPTVETLADDTTDLDSVNIYTHGSFVETRLIQSDPAFLNDSLKSIKVTAQFGGWNESGIKYEVGDGSIDNPPLNLTGVTSLRFSADLFIESGQDERASVRVKAKVWYFGGSTNSSPVEYTERQKWLHYEWTCENPNDKTIIGITFFFYDPKSASESESTIFYVDNIKVMFKESQRYIYFGNVMLSNDERCYTVEDAQRALYAYAGQHSVWSDDRLLSAGWSGATVSEATDSPIFSLPFVADFDLTSSYAAIYPMAVATDDTPIMLELNGGAISLRVRVKDNQEVQVGNQILTSRGRLRIVVTSLTSEGLIYTQDTTLVKDWLSVFVYMNDVRVISGAFPIYPETVLGDRLLFGSTSGTMTFTRLRVALAGRVVDMFSIDPGETASSPLGRLLGVSNLVPVSQPNGSLRLKAVKIGPSSDIDWVLPNHPQSLSREIDLMPVSHVRYTTARDERDVIVKRARAIAWLHTFEKKDDPNAITDSELALGSLGIITAVRRAMRTIEFGGPYNPVIELDDTLGSQAGDAYLVDGVSVTLSPESNTPVASAKYKLSGDWFGSLATDGDLDGNWYGPPEDGGGGEDPGGDGGTVLTAVPVPGSGEVFLAWNDTSFAKTGFRLERCLDDVNFELLANLDSSSLTHLDTGLSMNTAYYYRIRPYNSSRSGLWSNVAMARTDIEPSDTTVLSAFALPGTSSVQLVWNNIAFEETGYHLERGLSEGSFAPLVDLGDGVGAYLDATTEPGVTYYYRVCPFNGLGNDSWSNTAVVVAGGDDSEAIILTAASDSASRLIHLSWTGRPYNKTGYRLQRSLDGTAFADITTVSERTNSYSDYGLAAHTLYFYRVCAYNARGDGPWSNIASATTGDINFDIFPVTRVLDDFNRPDQGPPPSSRWLAHAAYFQGDFDDPMALKVVDEECQATGGADLDHPHWGGQNWGTSFNSDCEMFLDISSLHPAWRDENQVNDPETWTYGSVDFSLRQQIDETHNIRGYTVRISKKEGVTTLNRTVLYGQGGDPLASIETSFEEGDQFGLRCVGDRICVYRNGARILDVTNGETSIAAKPHIFLGTSRGIINGEYLWSWIGIDNFGGGNL